MTSMILMLAWLSAGYFMPSIQAFSTGKFSTPCVIGWRGRSTTCTYALFHDEDCEDLCGPFGEADALMAQLSEVEEQMKEEIASKRRELTSRASRRPSQRTRALWWKEQGEDKCKPCNGSGGMTCRFCGTTDFVSAIGGVTDALSSEGIGKTCPVCEDGIEVCHTCAGTGQILFSWKRDMHHTNSLHP